MQQNLNLNWLRTFEAVARLSGFTAASRELGLTQAAVSLQIKALEAKLGHDLFIRRPRSVQLTEIGKAYLPSVKNSLETLNLSTNGLFGPDLKSTIVVRASMGAIMWLAQDVGDFQERHPGIGIKFVTAIWTGTPDMQAVDVDIVLAPDTQINGRLEKLSDEFLVPICGKRTAGTVNCVRDLVQRNPIHILGFDDHWSRYMAEFDMQHDTTSTRLMVDTSVAACELVASDLGCAIVIERFAHSAMRTGQRIEIVGDRVSLGQSHFLVGRGPEKEPQASAEAFKEWLRARFAEPSN